LSTSSSDRGLGLTVDPLEQVLDPHADGCDERRSLVDAARVFVRLGKFDEGERAPDANRDVLAGDAGGFTGGWEPSTAEAVAHE
jgi:hypothetical protein